MGKAGEQAGRGPRGRRGGAHHRKGRWYNREGPHRFRNVELPARCENFPEVAHAHSQCCLILKILYYFPINVAACFSRFASWGGVYHQASIAELGVMCCCAPVGESGLTW
jgi:hypothetical protein